MYDFRPYNQKWVKVKTGNPPTEKQLKLLEKLGWKNEFLTKRGAWFIIDAILNS